MLCVHWISAKRLVVIKLNSWDFRASKYKADEENGTQCQNQSIARGRNAQETIMLLVNVVQRCGNGE